MDNGDTNLTITIFCYTIKSRQPLCWILVLVFYGVRLQWHHLNSHIFSRRFRCKLIRYHGLFHARELKSTRCPLNQHLLLFHTPEVNQIARCRLKMMWKNTLVRNFCNDVPRAWLERELKVRTSWKNEKIKSFKLTSKCWAACNANQNHN